jgi:hypothetical protein
VPGREAIEAIASRLSARGDTHDGVHRTPVGWVLLGLHDPDGHDVRFYTVPPELPAELAAHRHRDQPAEVVAESAER